MELKTLIYLLPRIEILRYYMCRGAASGLACWSDLRVLYGPFRWNSEFILFWSHGLKSMVTTWIEPLALDYLKYDGS